MDKNVYNMKVEKIQKQARNGDYETAAKICDTIDWSQVRSARMLTLVSSVYENVRDYDRAIDTLLMAYEEAPVGRRYLYRLTELAIKSGDIREAEEYYKSYLKEAPEDPSRYVLRYKLAEAKGEPLDKRIAILATYKRQEFDEEWAVRLAELYQKAGRREDCVRLCDEIILWFGVGPCVERAMELKETYEPLSASQRERRENRSYYEEKLAQMASESEHTETVAENSFQPPYNAEPDDLPKVAISEEMGVSFDESAFVNEEEEMPEAEELFAPPKDLRSTRENPTAKKPSATREVPPVENGQDFSIGNFVKSVMEGAAREQDETVTAQITSAREEAATARAARMETLLRTEGKTETAPEPDLFAEVPESELEPFVEIPGQEPEAFAEEPQPEAIQTAEASEPESTIPNEIDRMEAAIEAALEPEPEQMELVWEEEPAAPQLTPRKELLFVGCAVPNEGLNMAVDTLRKAYEKVGGELTQVAKISAAKLNSRGLLKSLPNLQNKDLIIVSANALSNTVLREIQQVREELDPQKFFVLLDRPAAIHQLKERLEQLPEEEELPQIIPSETIPDPVVKPKPAPAASKPKTPQPSRPAEAAVRATRPAPRHEVPEKPARDAELNEEQFIAQMKFYAASIDCVIDEKAIDAIYDVIDELREDGDPLSPAMAEEVVEDAADEAEHHSIRNLFHSKYNKEGKLILKARHFD